MTTEIVLQLNRPDDIALLLSFLEKSGIAFRQRLRKSRAAAAAPQKNAAKPETEKAPLSKYIGILPNLDVEAFERYLHETRNEWERDFS